MTGKELRGIVPIQLKNTHYKLYFSFNTLCDLEDTFPNLGELFQAIQRPSLKTTRLLLWAGLQHFHEGITLKEAGQLMPFHPEKIAEAQELVMKALLYAIPTEDEKEDKDELPEEMQQFLQEANDEKLKN